MSSNLARSAPINAIEKSMSPQDYAMFCGEKNAALNLTIPACLLRCELSGFEIMVIAECHRVATRNLGVFPYHPMYFVSRFGISGPESTDTFQSIIAKQFLIHTSDMFAPQPSVGWVVFLRDEDHSLEVDELPKLKALARRFVHAAVDANAIQKPISCEECGGEPDPSRLQAHHYDYLNPLAVQWLCIPCHVGMHKLRGTCP